MTLRRALALAIVVIAVVMTATASYVYLAPLFPTKSSSKPQVTVIPIPKGASSSEPLGFNFTSLTSPTFHFPVNLTVTIGVNNTVEWVNDDNHVHTVTAFIVPGGAQLFNSGFIQPGNTFSTTLAIPGVYKYACLWHRWLAGQITVKPD